MYLISVDTRIVELTVWQLLAPANEALGSPCLSGPITDYSWPEGIALMTAFVMFFIELMAARFDIFGEVDHHDLESFDPALDLVRKNALLDSSTGSNDSDSEKTGKNSLA